MNQTIRVIFAVILIALSFTYPANADSQKFNLRLKSDADLTGKTFANKTKRCGVNSAQSGDRHFEALVSIYRQDSITLTGGTFKCSTQNVIFIDKSLNIVIDKIKASKGSDNPIEIRNSTVMIKNSTFSDSPGNKCVETENSFVVFYKNKFIRCKNAFDMETTKRPVKSGFGPQQDIAIFLNNSFINIRDDGFHCHDRTNSLGVGHLFLKGNGFVANIPGYTFRKFGKIKDCTNVHRINKELEDAIKTGDLALAKKIAKDIITKS
tara:strand:+ start:36 stop:830 length:795 start_codon:yes stop_codon:yes gene_type:complete